MQRQKDKLQVHFTKRFNLPEAAKSKYGQLGHFLRCFLQTPFQSYNIVEWGLWWGRRQEDIIDARN